MTTDVRQDVIVVLGAAVRPGGEPSDPMRRRVAGALIAAGSLHNPIFMPTGGIGTHGPSEAEVMSRLLRTAGVPPERIMPEDTARSTLQSVVRCSALIRRRFTGARVVACTDVYHRLRTAWLFRLAGLRVATPAVTGGFSEIYLRRWIYYVAREFIAVPVDTIRMLIFLAQRRGDAPSR